MLDYQGYTAEQDKRLKNCVTQYPIPDSIPKGVCLDIGANVGYFSLRAAKIFDMVYALEACNWTYEKLVKNTAGVPNISTHHGAAASAPGEMLKLMRYDTIEASDYIPSPGSSSVTQWDNGDYGWTPSNGYEEIESVSLFSFMNDCCGVDHADYMKIDIEGGEFDFLDGQDLSMVGFIAMELHYMMGPEKHEKLRMQLEKTHTVHNWGPWVKGRHQDVWAERNKQELVKE